MANEELYTVRLRDEFYRDGFYRIVIAMSAILVAVVLLVSVSIYLFLSKPKPIVFPTQADWRMLSPVPVDKPYLTTPDLIQWVSNATPNLFTYDFIHYTGQFKANSSYFTDTGWGKYSDVINAYANADTVSRSKWFVSSTATGAPFVVNQGMLQGRYAWWVQMPLLIKYSNYEKENSQAIVLQVLVVRVPTLNNLYGVAIDNIVVVNGESNQVRVNGK